MDRLKLRIKTEKNEENDERDKEQSVRRSINEIEMDRISRGCNVLIGRFKQSRGIKNKFPDSSEDHPSKDKNPLSMTLPEKQVKDISQASNTIPAPLWQASVIIPRLKLECIPSATEQLPGWTEYSCHEPCLSRHCLSPVSSQSSVTTACDRCFCQQHECSHYLINQERWFPNRCSQRVKLLTRLQSTVTQQCAVCKRRFVSSRSYEKHKCFNANDLFLKRNHPVCFSEKKAAKKQCSRVTRKIISNSKQKSSRKVQLIHPNANLLFKRVLIVQLERLDPRWLVKPFRSKTNVGAGPSSLKSGLEVQPRIHNTRKLDIDFKKGVPIVKGKLPKNVNADFWTLHSVRHKAKPARHKAKPARSRRSHPVRRIFRCHLCSEQFTDHIHFARHIRRVWCCFVCYQKFCNKFFLRQHIAQQHAGSLPCDRHDYHSLHLLNNKNTKGKNKPPMKTTSDVIINDTISCSLSDVQRELYECELCFFRCRNQCHLQNHIAKHLQKVSIHLTRIDESLVLDQTLTGNSQKSIAETSSCSL